MNRRSPLRIDPCLPLRPLLGAAALVAAVVTGAPVVGELLPPPAASAAQAAPALDGTWVTIANGDRVNRLRLDGEIVWSSTDGGGVVKWHLTDGTFRQYLAPQDGLLSNLVTDTAVTPDGTVWAATDRGLARLDDTVDRFVNLTPDTSPGMPSRRVTALTVAPDGRLWVGFRQEWDPETVDPGSRLPGTFKPGGLALYDPVSGTWSDEQHVTFTGEWQNPVFATLPSENVTVIEMATDGILWIATEPYYLWEDYKCTGTDCPPEPGSWVQTGGGLAATKAGQWQYWSAGENEAGSCYRNIVRDLEADRDGRMWAATSDGLLLMRNGLQRIGCDAQVRYGRATNKTEGMRGRSVWSVDVDAQGRVWVGHGEGQNIGRGIGILDYHGTLDDFKSYDSDDTWEFVDLQNLPDESEYIVTALVIAGPDRIVFGTRDHKNGDGDGLSVYRPSDGSWRALRTAANGLPSNQIVDIERNPATDDIWFTLRRHGVAAFDGQTWRHWRMFAAGAQVGLTTVTANAGIRNVPTDIADRVAFDSAFPTTPRFVRFGDDPTLYQVTSYTPSSRTITVKPALVRDTPQGTPVLGVDRGPASDLATQLAIDAAGNVWAGGRESIWIEGCADWPHCWLDGGISRWDGQNWRVYEMTIEATGLDVQDQEVQSVAVDPRGRVWAGTGNPSEGLDGKGIFVLDPATETWTIYNTKSVQTKFFGSDGIADMARDPVSGDMWVAHHSTEVCDQSSPFGGTCNPTFFGGGVSHYNGTVWEKWTERGGALLKGSGSDGEQAVITIDRGRDRVWVGTFDTAPSGFHWLEGKGIDAVLNWCPLNCTNTAWQHEVWPEEGEVVALEVDALGRLWAGVHRYGYGVKPPLAGVKVLDGDEWTVITPANSGVVSHEITALHRDGQDMWVGTLRNGVSHYLAVAPPTPTPPATHTPRATPTASRTTAVEATPTRRPTQGSATASPTSSGTPPTTTTPSLPCGAGGVCRVYLPMEMQHRLCGRNCPTMTPRPPTRVTPTATRTATVATPTTRASDTPVATATATPPGPATAVPSATSTDVPVATATASRTATPTLVPPTATATATATPTTIVTRAWSVFEGSLPRDTFHSVAGTDGSHVWFVGERSQILFWDGTQMTSQIEIVPENRILRRVWPLSASRAFIVGDESTFVQTTNGGQLWRRVNTEAYTDDWWGVSVIDTGGNRPRGWLVGNLNGNRLYYDGTTWAPSSPADRNNRSHRYSDVAMLSATSAYAIQAAISGSRIYEWNGTVWAAGPATGGALYDLHVLSSTSGVAVGARGIVWRLQADGEWARMGAEPRTGGQDLRAVHMLSDDFIWAAGGRGGIYLWDGQAWTSHNIAGQVKSINGLWISPTGDSGWAVGDNGLFLRYE